MLINDVLIFIKRLSQFQLDELDSKLLLEFKSKFAIETSPEKNSSILTKDELQWIQMRFATRWQAAIGEQRDYILNDNKINRVWEDLAQLVGTAAKINPLLVLIPTISNEKDPDSNEPLSADPRSLFLTKDSEGTYCHNLSDLLARIEKGKLGETCGVTYLSDSSDRESRALPIGVLYQFKSTPCPRGFKKDQFKTVWAYLSETQIPFWRVYGECPTQIVAMLAKMADDYTQATKDKINDKQLAKAKTNFKRGFSELTMFISELPQQDVNYFYAIPVDTQLSSDTYKELLGNRQMVPLIELLFICKEKIDKHELLFETLHLIILAVNCIDPTLGRWRSQKISPKQAEALVSELTFNGCGEELQGKGMRLRGTLALSPEFNPGIIELIKTIYAERWEKIKDTENDYTNHQAITVNAPWLKLIQWLVATKVIEIEGDNYYKILIPTLQQDTDPILGVSIRYFPLTHCVLSEDGTALIYLSHCMNHHKTSGTFFNCNSATPCKLTELEVERLRYAAPRYLAYYERYVLVPEDPSINATTVAAVVRFVNGSLNPEGLIQGVDLNDTQQTSAVTAYAIFLEFIKKLPQVERERFYKQHISLDTHRVTVEVLLEKLQAGIGCVATCGRFFAKLVLDYDPAIQFSIVLEGSDRVGLVGLRQRSEYKLFGEYASYRHVNNFEAYQRLVLLYVSLLNYSFKNTPLVVTTTIRTLNFSNIVPVEIGSIFNELNRLIQNNKLTHARLMYAKLMTAIKPKSKKNDWLTDLRCSPETVSWVKSLRDESMFTRKENITCFEPRRIFAILATLLKRKEIGPASLVSNFIENVVKLSNEERNTDALWMGINLMFQQMLQHKDLSSNQKMNLLAWLRNDQLKVSDQDYVEAMQEFFVNHIVSVGISQGGGKDSRSSAMFGLDPGNSAKIQEELVAKLRTGYQPNHRVPHILTDLYKQVRLLPDNKFAQVKVKMMDYLIELAPFLGSQKKMGVRELIIPPEARMPVFILA